VIVICTIVGIPVSGFAPGAAERNLSISVGPINPHEALALGLQHGLGRILEPTIDKIAMEAVALANLSANVSIS